MNSKNLKFGDIEKVIERCRKRYKKNEKRGKYRHKSWEYCHYYFKSKRKELRKNINNIPDEAILMLGFYLASWGHELRQRWQKSCRVWDQQDLNRRCWPKVVG